MPSHRMISLAFFSTGFKRKGKARTAPKLKREIGVSKPFDGVEVVHDEPHLLQFLGVNGDLIGPVFVPVSSGPPREIPYVSEGDG